MKYALFNIHDLALLLVLTTSVALAVSNAYASNFRPPASWCLTAFYLLAGLIALDTLLFWGDHIRVAVFELSPWLLTVFCFSTFTIGPVLLWLVRLELTPNFRVQGLQLLHLAPAIIAPIYLYFVLYRYPLATQRDLLLNLSVYRVEDAHFTSFIVIKKMLPVIYGGLSLFQLYARANLVSVSSHNLQFLRYLTLGFLSIAIWTLATHFCGLWLPRAWADTMGIGGNYLTAACLLYLMFFHAIPAIYEPRQLQTSASAPSDLPPANEPGTVAAAEKISEYMEREKPYLSPRLTLERFAAHLQLPPRQVSVAINSCFEQNFQEYINRHRVEEAKRLLSDPRHSDVTMTDVASAAGFNSKASFNRIFKASLGITPSGYRRQLEDQHLPQIPHHG